MADVIIYSTANCPFCVRAKQLFERKGVVYTEIRVDRDDEQRQMMMEKSGRRSVPQIFIDGKPLGGFDDIYALDQQGELDKILQAK